ncbi:hypothetical protein J5X84_21145 [Streptosporangiaceae bacterium NEAU-GS5]|nr:hypothetical protein [Streptosporangiaceae bacterium NEAU-GS5]
MLDAPAWADEELLAQLGEGPHVIPVSAPVRADHRTILLSLHHSRDSLARLRARPEVALLILGDDVACTARGSARVVSERMSGASDYAAVEIRVTDVDDHRAGAPDGDGLAHRVRILESLAAIRRRCQVAGATSQTR